MVRTKMPSLETFQSYITKTPPNVTAIVLLFHGFRYAAMSDQENFTISSVSHFSILIEFPGPRE